SRTSGEKRFDFLFMAPSSQSLEPPQNPGRFRTYARQIERAVANPSLGIISALGDVLGKSSDQLLRAQELCS
uniref:hypothetical protein n=1 Tax=Rheinheimera sp. TaxID=1869214 RepID=UPI0040487397